MLASFGYTCMAAEVGKIIIDYDIVCIQSCCQIQVWVSTLIKSRKQWCICIRPSLKKSFSKTYHFVDCIVNSCLLDQSCYMHFQYSRWLFHLSLCSVNSRMKLLRTLRLRSVPKSPTSHGGLNKYNVPTLLFPPFILMYMITWIKKHHRYFPLRIINLLTVWDTALGTRSSAWLIRSLHAHVPKNLVSHELQLTV